MPITAGGTASYGRRDNFVRLAQRNRVVENSTKVQNWLFDCKTSGRIFARRATLGNTTETKVPPCVIGLHC